MAAAEAYEGLPLSDEVKQQASVRYIEVWTKAMDPFQEEELVVWDANTGFRRSATTETLESIMKEAVVESDRLWGRP